MSAVTEPDGHAVVVTGDSGSLTFHETATSPTYHPFWPSVPSTTGVSEGGVASTV